MFSTETLLRSPAFFSAVVAVAVVFNIINYHSIRALLKLCSDCFEAIFFFKLFKIAGMFYRSSSVRFEFRRHCMFDRRLRQTQITAQEILRKK